VSLRRCTVWYTCGRLSNRFIATTAWAASRRWWRQLPARWCCKGPLGATLGTDIHVGAPVLKFFFFSFLFLSRVLLTALCSTTKHLRHTRPNHIRSRSHCLSSPYSLSSLPLVSRSRTTLSDTKPPPRGSHGYLGLLLQLIRKL
jgi:hypothetical protein